MKLRVISNYGTEERTVSESATREQIIRTIDYLDWSGFHQVVLEKPNGDWLDVGGSLEPSDGLSIMASSHFSPYQKHSSDCKRHGCHVHGHAVGPEPRLLHHRTLRLVKLVKQAD